MFSDSFNLFINKYFVIRYRHCVNGCKLVNWKTNVLLFVALRSVEYSACLKSIYIYPNIVNEYTMIWWELYTECAVTAKCSMRCVSWWLYHCIRLPYHTIILSYHILFRCILIWFIVKNALVKITQGKKLLKRSCNTCISYEFVLKHLWSDMFICK